MSFHLNDDKLLTKYQTIYVKIENLKNIKFNVLPVYDNRYTKTKIRTYGVKVNTNFCSLTVPEDFVECESFRSLSIDYLLVYESK